MTVIPFFVLKKPRGPIGTLILRTLQQVFRVAERRHATLHENCRSSALGVWSSSKAVIGTETSCLRLEVWAPNMCPQAF